MTPGTEPSPLDAASRSLETPTDVPGMFITAMPPLAEPTMKELEVNAVNPPYSYSRVTYNDRTKEYLYEVIEPQLTARERELVDHLKSTLTMILGSDVNNLSIADKRTYLRGEAEEYFHSRGISLSPISTERIIYYVLRDFVGYGPVDALILDPQVEDISCDGVDVPLFIFHGKYESVKTNVVFADENATNSLIVMLGQRCSKAVSVSSPILDGTTPEGHRVQATYAREITTRGASFTIRRFKERPFTPVDLVIMGSASEEMVAYFWLAAEQGESLIICGGPAAGKTSTLNAIALFIPPTAKIVSIEDTRELNLPHENWVPSLTRAGFGAKNLTSGKAPGEIDMFDLLAAALRQRPQYLMVGEVRGAEAFIVFQAMATGKTCYTTFHAESVSAMVHRMENPPITLPRSLVSALNLVLLQRQVKVGTKMTRRVQSLTEIVGLDPETNELITNSVYSWNPADDTFLYSGHSYVYERVALMKNLSMKEMEREVRNRAEMMDYLVFRDAQATRLKPFTHRDVGQLVAFYYKEPDRALAEARAELAKAKSTAAATPAAR